MGRIIGIDLGTTYSAVTIPEERAADGFFTVRSCPGYSVVLDPFKIRITPSVVAEDDAGNLIVGRRAKNRAGMFPEPVMFAKRSMGENVTFKLNKRGEMTPTEISAEILKYLKKIAEDRLKEPVDEAVITVPAYFHLRAKQATEEAGRLAGLKVAQIAQEPVAAALMYCVGDTRDPLRVMTYDLGGGTFDIAVLEKRDGTITSDSVMTFDGDRFLGGYNFDNMLVDWLIEQLNERGYELALDPNNPQDRIIRSKLMVIAEETKIKLSDQENLLFQELPTGITDHQGNPVSLEGLSIDRVTFEAMIEPKIDYSIELCLKALNKVDPKIPKESLDEILMVGGSSRIPMVTRKLEEAFGRKPRLVEPDLCVALGAGILAGTKSRVFGRLRLDTIPKETDLPWITVTGRIEREAIGESLEGCSVKLAASDGSYQRALKTGMEGAFVFEEVTLTEEEDTEFTLSASAPDGSAISLHTFQVRQSAQAKNEINEIPPVLSKPILMEVVDGFLTIAPERTALPFSQQIKVETSDTSGVIHIRILEENNLLGEILMTDIPKDLPVGSKIEVEVMIQNNYQIHGRAYVPALAREITVVIDIPVPIQKSLDEVEGDYQKLAGRADEVLRSAGAGVRFGDARAKRLQNLMQETKELTQASNPEVPMIQDRLDEIESLIRDLGAGPRFQPPRSTFDAKVNDAQELLEQAISHKPHIAQEGFDKQIEMICAEADKAYKAQNLAAWKDNYNRLESLCKRLEGLLPPPPPPDPTSLLFSLASSLAALERRARDDGKYEIYRSEFEKLAAQLKQIDPKAPDAMNQIRDWYFSGFEELRRSLDVPMRDPGIPKSSS